jgi:hypothetical protein
MDLTNKGTRGKKPRKSSVLAHTKSIKKVNELKVDLTDEEIATIQSHHLVKPSFCSLYYLINDGISIGQLATAIENHGVYGWDQYGRYQHFKIKADANPEGSGIALNVLASIEADFRSNKASKLFVLSKYLDTPSHPAHFFGWPSIDLPPLTKIEEEINWEHAYEAQLLIKKSTMLLIGLMLQFIKGNEKWPRHSNYSSQQELADDLFAYAYELEKTGKINTWGLRDSTIKNVFAEANKQLK